MIWIALGVLVVVVVIARLLRRTAGEADQALEEQTVPDAIYKNRSVGLTTITSAQLTPGDLSAVETVRARVAWYAQYGEATSTGIPRVRWLSGDVRPVCEVCGQAVPAEGAVSRAHKGRFVWVHRWPCADRL